MWLCMKFNNSSSQLQASQRGRTGAAFQHTGQGLFESCHFLPVITQIEKKKRLTWMEFVPLGSLEMPEPCISNMLRIANDGRAESFRE